MSILRTPRAKVIAASALLLLLSVCGPLGLGDAVAVSRWLLAGTALVGIGLWLRRPRPDRPDAEPPPLVVTARVGLAPRCGIVLVQAEGRSYLIAHGDGFARIHPVSARSRHSRRSGRSTAAKVVLQ